MPQAKMREKPAVPLASPRFVDGKAKLIAGLRRVYGPREMNKIATLWQSFAPHIGKIAGQIGRTTYGVCWQASDGESIEYLSGVEVTGFAGIPSRRRSGNTGVYRTLRRRVQSANGNGRDGGVGPAQDLRRASMRRPCGWPRGQGAIKCRFPSSYSREISGSGHP